MTVKRREFRLVFCPEMHLHNGDGRTYANVHNGVAFCSACGATDHEEDK